MTRRIIILLTLAATLSSCNLYKNYTRGDVTTQGIYRDTVATVIDSSSLADLSWRQLFTDPVLQELIERGLANNTNLNIARLRSTEAEATLQAARLAYIPSVSITPQGTLSSAKASTPTMTYNIPITASWEIDIFGKLTNAKRRAKAAMEGSIAYRQAVQTQLISTIATSYYTLLMLDRQVEISEMTIINWRDNVRTFEALKLAGQATEVSVSQAKANALSAESNLLSLKQQINETENSLSTLLGEAAAAIIRGRLLDQRFPETLATGLPVQLLSRRPDVKQAELALAQAFYATNEARAAFYPSLTLSGSAGWTNSLGAAISNPGALMLQAVGGLVQPIFNRGRNIANLKIAKAQQQEYALMFQQSLLDAGAEVNNALTQFQTAQNQSVLTAQRVDALQTALGSTKLLMQHGTTNYLEVLMAQVSLLQAQLTEATESFDKIHGVINLYHALGGGAEE